jgi:hypothetical protein
VATESSTLFCGATGFDPDGDSLDLHYSWRVDGAPVAATTPSLTGTYFNKNQVVICEVMPDDGTSTGPSLSATGVTIQNSPPSAPGISITPSDPEEGLDPLVCAVDTPSNDADGDVLSYVFGWTRNGSAFSGAIPTSATSSTVAVDATLTGDVFVCSVTASDGTDSSSASVDSVEIEGNIYTIGYDTPFPTPETGFAGANYLLGERITVSYPAELFQLGVLLRLASTNSVYLALYRDSGGLPGSLVAYTNVTHLASYGTEVELDVVGGPVNLSVGYYWIMWNFSGATYAGFTTVGAAGNTIAYRNAANSASPPTTFGAATTYTGQHLNLYMVVR